MIRVVVHDSVPEDQALLANLYWELDDSGQFIHSVSDIASLSDFPAAKFHVHLNSFSTAYHVSQVCACCGRERRLTSRANYQELTSYRSETWTCQECIDHGKRAAEESARTVRQLEQMRLQADLDSVRWASDCFPELSLSDAVYFISLVRCGASEDYDFVAPIIGYAQDFASTTDFAIRAATQLYNNGFLAIHPGTHEGTVDFDSNQDYRYYPLKIHWAFPTTSGSDDVSNLISHIEFLFSSGQWPDGWHEQADELPRMIAVHECLQYLDQKMGEHGLDVHTGSKIEDVMRSCLQTFSIGQMYSFIWRSAKDAASFYLRKATSRQHAANIVPNAIRSSAERAVANGWEVPTYRRDFNVPQSMVSQVFFNLVTQLGDAGFTVPMPPILHSDVQDSSVNCDTENSED